MPKRVEAEITEERSMNEKEKKRNIELKRKTGSLSEFLGREKCIKIDKKRGKIGEMVDLEEESSKIDYGEEPKELTLAELKSKALRKKSRKKENGRKEVQIGEGRVVTEEYKKRQRMLLENRDMEIMTVEDSDFYDFDEDRVEKSFKKGQIWAIYDDDDGMPRHYGLIDDVVSLNPFEVKMSWLDLRIDKDERLKSWEKLGFHVSCGRFKVARNDKTDLLNIFSHIVECERAAKQMYRIYPKKGSIWALYNEKVLDMEGKDALSSEDSRHYDIVVFLTSYSETYGLSLAYLEKVDGFKAVFKRREVGFHAIRCLEKDDFRLFSHQIPARKLSQDEVPGILGDCWELDPASLPSDLLTVSRVNK